MTALLQRLDALLLVLGALAVIAHLTLMATAPAMAPEQPPTRCWCKDWSTGDSVPCQCEVRP
jgi:hypothetical protein